MNEPIRFRQVRDVEELLAAIWFFARAHWKPLGAALITFAGPFVLLSTIAMFLLQRSRGYRLVEFGNPYSGLELYLSPYFYAYGATAWVANLTILFVTFSYVLRYLDTGKTVSLREVRGRFASDFRINLTSGFAAMLASFVAVVPCCGLFAIFPVLIYVSVMWPARLHEKISFVDAPERAHTLLKNRFWPTLAFFFVTVVVQVAVSVVFSLPSMRMTYGSHQFSDTMLGLLVFVSSLIGAAGSLIVALFPIAATLNYFNLLERESPSQG